jgi:hypothetical protein
MCLKFWNIQECVFVTDHERFGMHPMHNKFILTMGATTTTAKGKAVQLNAGSHCFGCFCFSRSFVTCAESLR